MKSEGWERVVARDNGVTERRNLIGVCVGKLRVHVPGICRARASMASKKNFKAVNDRK